MKTKLIQVITCKFWDDEPTCKKLYLFNGFIDMSLHSKGVFCWSIEFSMKNRLIVLGFFFCHIHQYKNGEPSKLSGITFRLGKPLISIYTTTEERDRQLEATAKYIIHINK